MCVWGGAASGPKIVKTCCVLDNRLKSGLLEGKCLFAPSWIDPCRQKHTVVSFCSFQRLIDRNRPASADIHASNALSSFHINIYIHANQSTSAQESLIETKHDREKCTVQLDRTTRPGARHPFCLSRAVTAHNNLPLAYVWCCTVFVHSVYDSNKTVPDV